jgi:hypothetical protein
LLAPFQLWQFWPAVVAEGPYFESGHDIAVTPDEKGFILIRESDTQTGPREMQVVMNWLEELKQRAHTQN